MADASVAREEALTVWRSLGARRQEGDALRWLSRLSWFNGRKAATESYASEAVTVLEQLQPGRVAEQPEVVPVGERGMVGCDEQADRGAVGRGAHGELRRT